jgi:hypothetical protein
VRSVCAERSLVTMWPGKGFFYVCVDGKGNDSLTAMFEKM